MFNGENVPVLLRLNKTDLHGLTLCVTQEATPKVEEEEKKYIFNIPTVYEDKHKVIKMNLI